MRSSFKRRVKVFSLHATDAFYQAPETEDVVVDAPLQVSMPAVLLLWPIATTLVVTIAAFADWWSEVRGGRREQSEPTALQ